MSRKNRRQQQQQLQRLASAQLPTAQQAQMAGQAVQQPGATATAIQTSQWTGPLPNPEALEHFERILPGSANRLILLLEREQAFRIDAEKTALAARIAFGARGQYLGFSVAALAILAVVVTAYMGAVAAVSVSLVGVPVLGIVHALITGRHPDQSPQPTSPPGSGATRGPA